MLRLFDICYKQGVIDAYEMDDRSACEEFLQNTSGPKQFGLLSLPYDIKWREWLTILTRWALNNKMIRVVEHVFNAITTYNGYLAVVLPITFDFYVKGIKDYINNPTAWELSKFKNKLYAEWGGNTQRRMAHLVNDMQIMMFDRERNEEQPGVGLTKTAYKTFSMIVSREVSIFSKKRR